MAFARLRVIFPQIRATYKQRFSSTVYELLRIFEWKCGGGLADGGNRLHSCAASGAYGIHTYAKFYNTHSFAEGAPKVASRDIASFSKSNLIF